MAAATRVTDMEGDEMQASPATGATTLPTNPIVPPVPPPLPAASSAAAATPISEQVKPMRAFLASGAQAPQQTPLETKPVEVAPVVFLGIGSAVITHGLKMLAHFNGLRGIVQGFNEDGSYNAQLADGTGLQRVSAVNLKPCQEPASFAANYSACQPDLCSPGGVRGNASP
eukprot:TRINITY_DN44479_c0_g1_i1.p1 TRINITY_DN44479_c0_g1~~TRINITY_DN44479_c0_g1_i1.p1  ORF type:complete len:171 (-),score=25.51 TRINITY_DN44479_c0_g1_i1:40-552(-)